MSRHDVIIIGSGLGGLLCAGILARAGLDVLVLEQGAQPGGCMQTYRRQGLDFDTGFHYVGGLDEGTPMHAVFRHLGLMRLPWQRMDRLFDRVTIGGQTFAFAQGYDDFVQTLAADFPHERAALKRYARLLKQASAHEADLLDPAGAADPSFTERLMETNARQYLQSLFRDPLLIDVLSGTALKMELRRESLPLFTFVHGHSSYLESSWRLKGGASQLAGTLVRGIRAQGGEVLCKAQVAGLSGHDGKVSLARCADGTCHEAEFFISSLHPAATCALAGQSQPMRPAYRRRMAALENTYGMFTASLVLKPQAVEYFNHNHYVYARPDVWALPQKDGHVGGVLASCRVPEDGSPHARQIDLLTPMTWEQCLPWQDTRAGHRGDSYLALKARLADECIALAEQAVPGLRDSVEHLYTSTPLTYRDYTGTPQGSAYGTRKDCGNPLGTLLPVRTPIPNLLLTGQSLMLHGVHGVTMTALSTCAELIGKERIWNIIKGTRGQGNEVQGNEVQGNKETR